MKTKSFKSSLAVKFIVNLIFTTFLIADVSYAYAGNHHGNHGVYRHYGYNGYKAHSHRLYSYNGRHHYLKQFSHKAPVDSQLSDAINNSYNLSPEPVGAKGLTGKTLAQCQAFKPLNVFAEESMKMPYSSVPKAGYTRAINSVCELKRGVWAMRRAFRIDPEALPYLPLDVMGYSQVDALIARYKGQYYDGDPDPAFMVSALNFIKQDYAAAKKAIIEAEHYGDKSMSFTNLQRLIEQYSSAEESESSQEVRF